jgi:heme/copper-type cytochrome/quinol oxidase subunit 2
LHIGYGALKLIGAFVVFLAMRFAWGFIPHEEEIALDILASLISILPTVIAIFGVVDVFAGISLFSYRQWSRVLVIAVSVLNCFNIPIGTGIGIYSIWALMQPEVQEMFE